VGNYNGSVRCSVCYQSGHNKRSCPTYTKHLVKEFERHVASRDRLRASGGEAEYHSRRIEALAAKIGKRTGTNPLTKQKITKRGPTRKCSYCKHKYGAWSDEGLGHTRRTCQELKTDMAAMIEANKVYRAGVLENLRANGIGVGALLNIRTSGYFTDENGEEHWDRRLCPAIVRKIKWDQIAYCNSHDDIILTQRMSKMGTTDGYSMCELPYHRVDDGDGDYRRRFSPSAGWGRQGQRIGRWDIQGDGTYVQVERLGGVPADCIRPPAGWENGESPAIIEHFKSLKK
jgi:hypothetical protein